MGTLFFFVVVNLFANVFGSGRSGVAPELKLNDGRRMPAFGLGTWLGFPRSGEETPEKDAVQKAVEAAIDAGYRHIDTAAIYNTEDQVGAGINKKIAEGVIKREDIFVTTKLWNDRHAKEEVIPALKESLSKLKLDYVDLYLIHWPIAQFSNGTYYNTDYLTTWQGMVEAHELGLAKSIGVSNFNQQMLERITKESGVKPAVLQVEVNLNLQQPSLLSYCRSQDIAVMAYTPFGSLFPSRAMASAPPPRVDDPALKKIAEKYNKTVSQVVLRYLHEIGVVPIPKSVTKSRVEQNIDIFDFSLNQEEKDLLRSYDKNYRAISPTFWAQSPYYPFEKN